MQIFTIGYEGLQLDLFLSLLREHDIETVVDVRALPLSRKRGFSKTALRTQLQQDSIDYLHMRALGCPKDVRYRYRDDGDWARYTRGFLRYLATQQEAIAELENLANASRCCLLCYEADANFCHRSFIAAELHADEIIHITANSVALAALA